MTHLVKPVKRSTDVRVGGSRPISVELKSPGILVLRERNRRTGYEISIAACYVLAAKLYADKEAKRKLEEKNLRRIAAGKKPLKGSSLIKRRRR